MKQENPLVMTLVLFLVCVISAGGLSFLYINTKPKIEENKLLKEVLLKKQMLNSAEKFKTKSMNGIILEEAYDKDDKLVGFILKSECRGYAGPIEYMIAISTFLPFEVISLKILSHKETPGLGANITKEKFISQFIGKKPKEIILKKDDINGKIDSISGATITSRAITNSIKHLLEKEELVKMVSEKNTGSTTQLPKKVVRQTQEIKQQILQEESQKIPQLQQEQQ